MKIFVIVVKTGCLVEDQMQGVVLDRACNKRPPGDAVLDEIKIELKPWIAIDAQRL